MPDLTAAHRGYEYQDLLAAARSIDVLLGTAVDVWVDEKLVPNDRFDDLTVVGTAGRRQRIQFKHKDNDDQPLTLATFVNDDRGLRLDKLVIAMLADRDGPGRSAQHLEFRIVLRDGRPVDDRLLAVLRPASPDPGPALPGMSSYRMRFDAERLRRHAETQTGQVPGSFAFLRSGATPIAADALTWACSRLVVEVEAPSASWDLLAPGPAERLLLNRLRSEIGVEAYPNEDRSAADVGSAAITVIRSARQRTGSVSRQELLRRTQLRHDFGAVARLHPVDTGIAIDREHTTRALAAAARAAAGSGSRLLVTGPPGHGKSWACQALVDALTGQGWLVAEHYCYLSDADGDRDTRVATESLFGSLLSRLAEADPAVVAEQRPLFAADEYAVVTAVGTALAHDPDRPVALIIDGIDHVTRVRGPGPARTDPSLALATALAELKLPENSVLIVLSQPGQHLRPLHEAESAVIEVPGLQPDELARLAAALTVIPGPAPAPSVPVDDGAVAEFLAVLHQRSAGNALYATYLCREILRRPAEPVDPASTLKSLPLFDGTLENYYRHLHATLDPDSSWIADVIALIDFTLTRDELREIRPAAGHRVDAAIDALAPVLLERSTQGGIRVYHESFSRFLRIPFQDDEIASTALFDEVAIWLDGKGLFNDVRAFRSLLPLLAEAGRDHEVVRRVDRDFVVDAVAAGFPASATVAALTVAVGSAARAHDWPAVVRMVELARAASTFQWERYETTVTEFADVQAALIGAEALAERLLHEGRTVMSARAGLQMCAAVDRLDAVPPWREYLNAHVAETRHDNTIYGDGSDQTVHTAWLRGRLRLSAASGSFGPSDAWPDHRDRSDSGNPVGVDGGAELTAQVDWREIAHFCDENRLPATDVVEVIVDTYGPDAAIAFLSYRDDAGAYCLALAEATAIGHLPGGQAGTQEWAHQAIACGTPPGSVLRLDRLGIDGADLASSCGGYDREHFLELTRSVQTRSVRFEADVLSSWIDACAVAATHDAVGLNTAESLITGPGWYPCWLKFVLALMRAKAIPETERSAAILDAVRLLNHDLNPFSGDPRACDLYALHDRIADTVRRALQLVDEQDWCQALDLLQEVSDGISTTFRGELGGPLAGDLLLQLAFDTAPAAHLPTVAQMAAAHAEERSAGTYYSDLAEVRLTGARIALEQGDQAEARRLWAESCRLLVAYGWRKDITIYELLDPLPCLIRADPARGRARVAAVQALCERIPQHTDGKETRHAPARWWELIAAADPAALAELVAPRLFSTCNDSHHLLDNARTDLWRAWHAEADPVVAGTLRLSLDLTVDKADPALLRRLADTARASDTTAFSQLATLLLARADERPYRYPYSNSDELLARDSVLVAEANAALYGLVAPAEALPQPPDPPEPEAATPRNTSRPSSTGRTRLLPPTVPTFPPGPGGLARAIRAWRSEHYADTPRTWTFDRAANALGYRLLELAHSDHADDATAALHALASDVSVDGPGLLTTLAAGLHRHGETALAATAYALIWTRTRGGGGFRSFGGETELDSLRHGADLDPAHTQSVVADEIQAVLLRSNGGAWGMTYALVIALASGSLIAGPGPSVDAAFRAWDEAHAVIDSRAPRVHPSDDPDHPYRPAPDDMGTPAPGGVDRPLTTAVIAGLASASREAKRRALLATGIILTERPELCADGLRIALSTTSCAATLGWLLQTLIDAPAAQGAALARSETALTELTARPELSIRVMARQLLVEHARPPLTAPAAAEPELLAPPVETLWTPGNDPAEPDAATGAVRDVAGSRLDAAEPMLPGLAAAVVRRVTAAMTDPKLSKRMRQQLRSFAGPRQDHWPDAFLGIDEATEDALQRTAGGGRTAWFSRGEPLQYPEAWEERLGLRLVDDPTLALAIEHTRRSRPDLPLPPGPADPVWTSHESLGQRSQPARTAHHDHQESPTIDDLSCHGAGWHVFASAERLTTFPTYPDTRPFHTTWRIRAIETGVDRGQPLAGSHLPEGPPVAPGDISSWLTPTTAATPRLPRDMRPLVALDRDLVAAGDARTGLGLPDRLLVPTPALIQLIELRPSQETPFLLCREDRPAMVLVTWRCLYVTSDYHLPRPRLVGSAILIRPSAYQTLTDWAQGRLVSRDFSYRTEQDD